VILFLAILPSPTDHAPLDHEYPMHWGQTTTDVSQTTLSIRNPPELPVVIRIILHPRCCNYCEVIKEDISTCNFGREVELRLTTTTTDDSTWIVVSHTVFQNHYDNKSLNLRGMELCMFVNDPECSFRVLKFFETSLRKNLHE
jgi:hypothetical protein